MNKNVQEGCPKAFKKASFCPKSTWKIEDSGPRDMKLGLK